MTAFGQTNWNGSDFGYYANEKPVFYGGSSIPPADGILPHQHTIGYIMYFYLSTGGISILSCSVFTAQYKHKAVLKRLSLSVSKGQKVHGFSLWWQVGVPILMLVGIECILVVIWAIITEVRQGNVVFDSHHYMYACQTPQKHQIISIVLIVYNSLLLCVAAAYAIATRGVEVVTGESAFTSVIVSTFSVMAVVVIPVLQSETNPIRILALQTTALWVASMISMGYVFIPAAYTVFSDIQRMQRSFAVLPTSKAASISAVGSEGNVTNSGSKATSGKNRGMIKSIIQTSILNSTILITNQAVRFQPLVMCPHKPKRTISVI
ncbi:hypothetical protein BDR26DRAFT_870749 [Obelidium mucronatum]|nr:hypothetical protein BDR26DRAFT_870749 [Obelidium mucronatum]